MNISRALDKTGSLGALVSVMPCAGCFPALGSLGAAIGLGPLAVLVALWVVWHHDWSIYLFYAGIALMLVMSFLDLLLPARVTACSAPTVRSSARRSSKVTPAAMAAMHEGPQTWDGLKISEAAT